MSRRTHTNVRRASRMRRMPWMSTEMPPLTPTASCSGSSTSAAAAVAVSVRLRKMARRSVSPTATGRASGCTPCLSFHPLRRNPLSRLTIRRSFLLPKVPSAQPPFPADDNAFVRNLGLHVMPGASWKVLRTYDPPVSAIKGHRYHPIPDRTSRRHRHHRIRGLKISGYRSMAGGPIRKSARGQSKSRPYCASVPRDPLARPSIP